MAVNKLHRHPVECRLSRQDYNELIALQQIEREVFDGPTLCKSCRKGRLIAQLADKESQLTCEDCGKQFEDPDIKRQLESI